MPLWIGQEASIESTTGLGVSEDCLFVEVLVPINPVSQNLPVMVQLHGGGYIEGSIYTGPGDGLVNRSDGNLIYVQMQYRLAMLGFLGGSQVAANGVRNAGLLDQRLALMWVQKYIKSFGGDPSQVTIIGMSSSFEIKLKDRC